MGLPSTSARMESMRGFGAEQDVVQCGFGDLETMLQLFVRREVAHQAMQGWDVGWGRWGGG